MIRFSLIICLVAALFLPGCGVIQVYASASATTDKPESKGEVKMQQATFGAGCFWGVEAAFRSVEGVVDAECGYAGGTLENPTYQQVCYGNTGHAEVVRVTFDPDKVSYERLLEVFWKIHDPTQVNRQGPDIGNQYRSVIFGHSPEQITAANASKAAIDTAGRFNRPIATQIATAPTFYRAEEYHQHYFEKSGRPSCHVF